LNKKARERRSSRIERLGCQGDAQALGETKVPMPENREASSISAADEDTRITLS